MTKKKFSTMYLWRGMRDRVVSDEFMLKVPLVDSRQNVHEEPSRALPPHKPHVRSKCIGVRCGGAPESASRLGTKTADVRRVQKLDG